MTANELDNLVRTIRDKGTEIQTRRSLAHIIYDLKCGANAIGRNELAAELEKLYEDMEKIDTVEVMKMETFS